MKVTHLKKYFTSYNTGSIVQTEQVKFKYVYKYTYMLAITISFKGQPMNFESEGVYGKFWKEEREVKI